MANGCSITLTRRGRGSSRHVRRGFTLIELMVTIGVIMILATLTMLAMSNATEAAQIAKTKALIARLNALIMPRYEQYRYRRLPIQMPSGVTAQQAAQIRCDCLRQLMRMEMPDRWTDIIDAPVAMTSSVTMPRPSVSQAYLAAYNYSSSLPGFTVNGADGAAQAGVEFQGAKCLYMIVTMGLEENDVMENFQSSEYKDYDNTGAKVFIDAWGKPIRFLRWAPGFMTNPYLPSGATGTIPFSGVSRLQTGWDRDQTDPTGVYGNPPTLPAGTNAAAIDQPAVEGATNTYALYPLIYSAGPDGYFDIVSDSTTTLHYSTSTPPNNPFASVNTPTFPNGPVGVPSVVDAGQANNTLSHYDNVHNHLLGSR
jgi:prepilin-type N-terminal cleavage/methylation domain-containing protein